MQYQDGRGVSFTASSANTLDQFENALNSLLGTYADPEAAIKDILINDDEFIVGHCFNAYVNLLAIERSLMPTVAQIIKRLDSLSRKAADHELEHIAAVKKWYSGDLHGAVRHWENALLINPRDLLAMRLCHDLAFFLGDCRNLRDSVARVKREWRIELPGYGYLLGMHAFGLEECGDYSRAEDIGREALAINPRDSWAVHAVAHVMEMTGRHADGIDWLNSRESDWAYEGNFFAIHNWWHLAMYHIDLAHYDRVLELYDGPIRGQKSGAVLDLVDAASMLWRLYLAGQDVSVERWSEVADCWMNYVDDGIYAFNDLHVMMGLAASGRFDAANSLITSMQKLAEGPDTTHKLALRGIGLPACRGFLAFALGNYAEAVDHLLPVRYRAFNFGGSHAQRDVLSWTVIEAMLRAGQFDRARAVLNERLELKASSPQNWCMVGRAYNGLGRSKDASAAIATANRFSR
ncbi:MAG: tetratricopeptide (TPR) repeat protein [Gammaproteobacteria bacterium]|jgi:tetratricopeptide (TPR) repeat protein